MYSYIHICMYTYNFFINMPKVTSLCMLVYVKKHKVTKCIGNKIHNIYAKYQTTHLCMLLQRSFLYK